MRALLLVPALALAACDGVSDDQPPTFGDPYTVLVTDESPSVTDDGQLAVTVEYAGGCEDHEFRLRSRADGDATEVWWVHDAKGDTCEAIQTATFRARLPGTAADAERVTLLTPAGEVPLQIPARR